MSNKNAFARGEGKGCRQAANSSIAFPRGNLQHLDDTNRKIIAMLQHDGRSFSSIARDLGISGRCGASPS